MSFEERQSFKEYLNLVEKCMNPYVDPRDNFAEYTNGRFRDQIFNHRNGEHPPSMYACDNIFKCVLDNEQISNAAVEKARDFYRSRRACLEGGLKEYLRSDQFNEYCGGLPAFNENWNAENFDWAKAAGILLALQFNSILSLRMEHSGNTKVIFMFSNVFSYGFDSNMEDEILKILDLEDFKLAEIINDLNFYNVICPESFGLDARRLEGLELHNYIDIFDFKVFIETALSVTIQDYDMIHIEDGVLSYLTFLSRLNRRVLANCLTAMATYEHIEEVGEKFFDVNQARIFRPILISACFEKFYNEEQDKKFRCTAEMFKQTFESVKKKFPEYIRFTEYEAFRVYYDRTLDYIKRNYNISKISKEYENLQISPDNFHQNLIRIKNYGIPNSVKRCDSFCEFDQEDNLLVTSFLCNIIVHWNKPIVFHFSGQEVLYWRYLIAARDEHSEENCIERDNFHEMLRTQAKEFKDLDSNFEPEEITYSIEGIKYAYRDYKKWMEENESTVKWQNEILSRINLDCEQLFFMAFSQHLIYFDYCKNHMTILTLMNCEDFSKCFKCCTESRMNPRKFLV